MARRPAIPRCHVCHRRALRFVERRGCYLCGSGGKVFDPVVVERHNPGVINPQMALRVE